MVQQVPVSFAPPQAWRRSRRVLGLALVAAMAIPAVVVGRVLTIPAEAAKLHGAPLAMTTLVGTVLLPLIAIWLVAQCFWGAERLRFEIADGTLIVHTLTSRYKLALAGATVARTDAKLTLRLAGTGLPGFYTGYYLLGDRRARVWATQRQGGVVVDGEKRWFVTPADADGFVAAATAAGARLVD